MSIPRTPNNEAPENTPQELPKETIEFLGWDWGTPAEILETLDSYFQCAADDCAATTIREIEDAIEESKNNPNYLIDKAKECENDLYKSVFEYIVEERFCGGRFDEEFYEMTDFYNKIFPLNAKKVYDCFHNTEAFSIIIEAMGILGRINEAQKELWEDYHKYHHCSGWRKEDVIEIFGKKNIDFFDPEKEPDYEAIVESFVTYQEQIEGMDAAKRLYEIAARLRAYNRFFLDPQEPRKLRADIAEHNRTKKAKFEAELEKIPPANRTAPTTLKKLAECWGGDMTPKKLKGLIKSGRVTAAEMNRQTYVFHAALLPEWVVKAIKI